MLLKSYHHRAIYYISVILVFVEVDIPLFLSLPPIISSFESEDACIAQNYHLKIPAAKLFTQENHYISEFLGGSSSAGKLIDHDWCGTLKQPTSPRELF